jgi:predicted MFS family arabinose efflux permease
MCLYQYIYHSTITIRGYTIAAYPIGGVVGSFISMYSNVLLGRRHNIMLTCVLFIIGNVISAVSINVPMVRMIVTNRSDR